MKNISNGISMYFVAKVCNIVDVKEANLSKNVETSKQRKKSKKKKIKCNEKKKKNTHCQLKPSDPFFVLPRWRY